MSLQAHIANRLNLRNVAVSTMAAIGFLGVAGCGSEPDAQSAHDKQTQCMEQGLDGRSLIHELPVDGESFGITAQYSTKYDVDSWKITDTKTLDIKMSLKPDAGVKDVPEVEIENLHADVTIKAHKQSVNGLKQDTFDDHLHTGTQSGFLITPDYPYNERFVVEGYSETLISGWGFVSGGTGYSELEQERLNETNLIKQGAYGEEFNFVADILVRNKGEAAFHKDVVADSFIVPLAGKGCGQK